MATYLRQQQFCPSLSEPLWWVRWNLRILLGPSLNRPTQEACSAPGMACDHRQQEQGNCIEKAFLLNLCLHREFGFPSPLKGLCWKLWSRRLFRRQNNLEQKYRTALSTLFFSLIICWYTNTKTSDFRPNFALYSPKSWLKFTNSSPFLCESWRFIFGLTLS